MRDGLIRFAAEGFGEILVDDERMPAGSTLPYGPGNRRVSHARYDHLSADFAAHALADAKSWRSVFAEQSEAVGVFHRWDTLPAIKCF
jgi:hypothetical protein